jgi:hypothetical protein
MDGWHQNFATGVLVLGRDIREHVFAPLNLFTHCNHPVIIGTDAKRQLRHMIAKRTSKWADLGGRVAKLRDGESIVVECEGEPVEEASRIRSGLNGIRACRLVQRSVKVVDGRIVITREGIWPALSAFQR